MTKPGVLTEPNGKPHSDQTMRLLNKLKIKPTQEAFLTLAYPDEEVTGEILANLPDFFHKLPKK